MDVQGIVRFARRQTEGTEIWWAQTQAWGICS